MDVLQDSIAIVGIACQFPGAKSKDEFWNNLIENKESIKFFSNEELEETEFEFEQNINNPNYVKARGALEGIEEWDAHFFNVIPAEAKTIDPQQRLWLENTWHAFEDAGINPFDYKGNIGVFTGSFFNTYVLNNLLRDPVKYEQYIRARTPELFQTFINSDPMFLATKTAYHYNLKGPAIAIQTACSTSLVAVAQACNSLLSYESDVCVSGGVTVIVPQQSGYIYDESGIKSPDGHCRPFDKNSKGTVFSNGVGTVILKRLKDAIKDNDRIYSIIRGWSVNNDGYQKIGFTAPSIDGQYKAISSAIKSADIDVKNITYVEAHGTATPLGDPIEVAALTKAFRNTTDKKQFCGIGSVKSNIGHLDVAAGVAGLIKIALSAYYRKIPATINYTEPNSRIDFSNSPFYVVNENISLSNDEPIIMGVSALGVGGTNAHIIIEDYKQEKKHINISSPKILLHSAKSRNSLVNMNDNLVNYLTHNNDANLDDIAYTLQNRRNYMPYRSFAIFTKGETLTKELFINAKSEVSSQYLYFMFPGQGAQFVSMGKQLYETEPIFKASADNCFKIYQKITGFDLKEIIFSLETELSTKTISKTQYTQPALFIIEYSLACLYNHFGVRPDYYIGHSIGEYTAACLSKVFDLETALAIVIKRGLLMQSMPEGNMMAVTTDAENLISFKGDLFEIAANNSHAMCTISYHPENENKIIEIIQSQGYKTIPLSTSHAFHSKDFIPILIEFEQFVDSFSLNEPEIPFISSLTGKFIEPDEATSGKYWAQQLRHTVQFKDGINTLLENDNGVFIEVGPNTHLSGLVNQNINLKDRNNVLTSIGKLNDVHEQKKFYKSLGELWIRGIEVDFTVIYNESIPNFVALPSYPFDKKRYWVDFQLKKSSIQFQNYSNQSIEIPDNSTADAEIDDRPSLSSEYIIARTDSEKIITTIWQEQLGINKIGIIDNFFDLGGHSLLAIGVVGKINATFKLKIKMSSFFERPKIKDLAELIDAQLLYERKSIPVDLKIKTLEIIEGEV